MTHSTPEPSPKPSAPASGRLFFAERLPSGPDGESPAEAESRVLLDIETGAPLPADRLAYGWVRLPSREILYYAAPRERVPAHDSVAPAGTVLPAADDVVLPEGVDTATFLKASRDFYADLRPRSTLAELRARSSADSLIGKILLPLKLAAVAGLLLLLVAGVLNAMSGYKQNQLDAEAPALKLAESRADTLVALEHLEGPGRSLFDALAVVNPHRPEGVGFSRASLADNRELTVEGRAPDVSGINRMKDALQATGFFSSIDLPKLDASGGRSSFRMRLLFKSWPKVEGAPEPAPVAPATPPVVIATPDASPAEPAPVAGKEIAR